MPTYSYTALTAQGEKVSGTEAAENERELGRVLHEKGLVLTLVGGQEKKKFSVPSFGNITQSIRGVSLTDKLLFTRNLQVMMAAGIPLPKALDVLEAQARSGKFKKIIADLKKKVVEGQSLSEAMQEHIAVFPEIFTNMLKVGEESGTLEEVLKQLTLQLEREHDLRSKVMGALLYPAVIVIAMIGVGTLMLIVVIPKLAETFEGLGIDLPLTTRVIIGLGLFLSNFWYIAIPGFLAILFALWRATKTKPGKHALDSLLLKTPLFGNIVRKLNAALLTRTLSSLIAAGVPIVRALEVTSGVVSNVYFRDSLKICAEEVKKGAKLSSSLKNYQDLYPVVVVQMVEVGEETGETGNILSKLAEFYEEEITQITKNLTSIIEPVLMLIIGSMVGFFAISMIQPMYGMLGSLE